MQTSSSRPRGASFLAGCALVQHLRLRGAGDLHSTVLDYTRLSDTNDMLCFAIVTILCTITILDYTLLCSTLPYSTLLYSTLLCSTALRLLSGDLARVLGSGDLPGRAVRGLQYPLHPYWSSMHICIYIYIYICISLSLYMYVYIMSLYYLHLCP